MLSCLNVGLVQDAWHEDPKMHEESLRSGVAEAARDGAQLVCMQELTLSNYFCTRPDINPAPYKEDVATGPTAKFLGSCALEHKIYVTGSLFSNEGYNTAVAFGPDGKLVGCTRKQHIPSGDKYHEDYYFRPGDSDYPLHNIAGHMMALPTCYDQWFPELSRIYGLKGAEVIVYPTAIGAEPTAPGFDTQPMWQKVMLAQGIMANCFIVAVNRIGVEDDLEFYGSSFISNPYGEVLIQAPRNKRAVIVAELNFSERELWGRLFPFAKQREPTTYQKLVEK